MKKEITYGPFERFDVYTARTREAAENFRNVRATLVAVWAYGGNKAAQETAAQRMREAAEIYSACLTELAGIVTDSCFVGK